jgi:DNA-binding transcriptional regulator GbsR (MarR family)
MTAAGDVALREWVEQLAILLERDGLPRMAGRVFGWLLVCEPAEQSSEELALAVHGSKASMSTMTRLLGQAGLVEKVRRPGARRDVFRVRPEQWQQLWRSRMQMVFEVTALVERGLGLVAERGAESRARLAELHAQYQFFGRVFPQLLARWERERTAELARDARAMARSRVLPARPGHAARPPASRRVGRR